MNDYNPADKFGWKEGDLVFMEGTGTGEPLLDDEDIARIMQRERDMADEAVGEAMKADLAEKAAQPAACSGCREVAGETTDEGEEKWPVKRLHVR